MKIGYLRISNQDENHIRQVAALSLQDCDRMVEEESFYATKKRPALDKLLTEMKSGDTLVVWGFERISYSLTDLRNLIEQLHGRGIILHALKEGFLSSNGDAEVMLKTLGSIATFKAFVDAERSVLAQKAIKEKGVKVGGERKLSDRDMQMIFALIEDKIPKVQIAKSFGISEKNLNKALRDPRYMGEVILRPRRNTALKLRLREVKQQGSNSDDDTESAETRAEPSSNSTR